MSSFREVFTNRHIILPVIQIETGRQVEANLKIVQDSGCDGAFLIDMIGYGAQRLVDLAQYGQAGVPDIWVGLNFKNTSVEKVFENLGDNISGIWVHDAGINEKDPEQYQADDIHREREMSGWTGLYFGGVAFEDQPQILNLENVTKTAVDYVDVVTTSGTKTGAFAGIDKIRVMKQVLGKAPLAVAGGISPENVSGYLKYADCFLASSSLQIPGTANFDPERVRALVQAIR
jgi:uncharacterized protein